MNNLNSVGSKEQQMSSSVEDKGQGMHCDDVVRTLTRPEPVQREKVQPCHLPTKKPAKKYNVSKIKRN